MRILFLSHYFPPEVNAPASRTYEHCKQWVKEGHDVTVVTCAPNHPQGVVYEGYKNRLFQREENDGIKVVRLWTYVTANEGFVKRTLNYISYMCAVIFACPFLPKTDVVLSTSPQFFNGLAGYVVSRMKRAPWLLEIRDLWPESILTVGAIKHKTVIRVLEYLEMFAYCKADRIVPVTDAFKKYMINKGIDEEKIAVIKNGVDLDFYQISASDNKIGSTISLQDKKIDLAGKFVASYVGTHGMAHHLETVLEAANELRDQPNIVFLLVGEGAERKNLLLLKDKLQLENVVMLEQQPKEMMPVLWQLSDVSLVILKKSDLFKTVIPSKIFESMAMKKPIVLGVTGESQEIIENARSGICIEPENSQQLAEVILRLFRDKDLVAELGENGRQYVAEHFDRKELARRYLSILENLLVALIFFPGQRSFNDNIKIIILWFPVEGLSDAIGFRDQHRRVASTTWFFNDI